MSRTQFDTSHIESALAPFSEANPSGDQVRDCLEFCNALIGADKIEYDGQVRRRNEERIGSGIQVAASSISDPKLAGTFESLFEPITLDRSREGLVVAESISQSFSFLDELSENISSLKKYLRGRGPTNPSTFLLPYLRTAKDPSEDILQELLSDKTITGRRFYWGILSNEEIRARLSSIEAKGLLSESLLSLLFTMFRVYFAYNRAGGHADNGRLYLPSQERRRLIGRVLGSATNKAVSLEGLDGLQSRVVRAWDAVGGRSASIRPTTYLGYVSAALMEFDPKDKSSFLEACVEARSLDVVKHLRDLERKFNQLGAEDQKTFVAQAVSVFTTIYSKGQDPKAEAKKSLLVTWFLASFSLLPKQQGISTIATLLDAIKDTGRYCADWETKNSRAAMLLGKSLMPCILPTNSTLKKVKRVFGVLP